MSDACCTGTVGPGQRPCPRCARIVSETPSGHLRAHECPHGSQCVVPYARRRQGEKPAHCGVCAGAPDTRLEPGQMPMPFMGGIRKKLRRPSKARVTWPLANGCTGRPCPACGCDRDRRCSVQLPDGGVAACLPAGSFGRSVCSACRTPNLPGVE